MDNIEKFFHCHDDFLKGQAESYALCTAFFAAGLLCFKYMENLFYIPGAISGFFLWVVSVALFFNNIKLAEEYVAKKLYPKNSMGFVVIGVIYISSVVCIGFSIIFEAF